ncbi:MAG: presqualene diphosphate synthase HpnD [Chloroflexi bacterium]|nr:presqualene diphosphate synthase HpnD [Chloroflexota bacterium]
MTQTAKPPPTPPYGGEADDTEAAYAICQAITREGAKNFYYAFLTLPKEKRKAIYAAYAFCRVADDIADDEDMAVDRVAALSTLRETLLESYEGNARGAVFSALSDAAQRYSIPEKYFDDVIKGVEMDLHKSRYATFEELREYCYYVASAVGLICIEIFEYTDPKAIEHAIDLGIAMQLTNIMRDVAEDAANGRIYLPKEDMDRFGYTEEELLAGVNNQSFRSLMAFEAARARDYFERGRMLYPLLDRRSRACPKTLESVYSRLLDRMEAEDFPVFEKRVSISRASKIALVARHWLRSVTPLPW